MAQFVGAAVVDPDVEIASSGVGRSFIATIGAAMRRNDDDETISRACAQGVAVPIARRPSARTRLG
jgi:hypothetical protein